MAMPMQRLLGHLQEGKPEHPRIRPLTVYPNLAARLAMKIEKEYNFRWIYGNSSSGAEGGISEKVLIGTGKLNRKITVEATKLKKLSKNILPRYDKIQRGIEARLAQLSVPFEPHG